MMLFISILFHIEKVFADIRIENGFFVIDSSPHTTTLNISDSDVIYCSGSCRIVSDELSMPFNFKGFNTIKNIALLTKSEKNWNSFQNTIKSRAASLAVTEEKDKKKHSTQQEDSASEMPTDKVENDKGIMRAEKVPSSIIYSVPYPSDKTVFLHQSGGKVFFLPKNSCDNGCTGFVRIIGTKFSQRISFEKGQKPFWSIQIPMGTDKSEYHWSFEDGTEKQNHSFFVWKQNKENFRESLSVGNSIEVLTEPSPMR